MSAMKAGASDPTVWHTVLRSPFVSLAAAPPLPPRVDIMALLCLAPIKDRMVGRSGQAGALSPGQRKVLSIAVELASNCPILFLG